MSSNVLTISIELIESHIIDYTRYDNNDRTQVKNQKGDQHEHPLLDYYAPKIDCNEAKK